MNLKRQLMLGVSSLAIACSVHHAQAMLFEGRPASEYLEAGVQRIAVTHVCIRKAVETAKRYNLSAGCNLIKGYESLSADGRAALDKFLGVIMNLDPATGKHAHAIIDESPELAKQLRPGHNNVTNLMWGVRDFFQYYAREVIFVKLCGINPARAELLIKAAYHAPDEYILPKEPGEDSIAYETRRSKNYLKDSFNELYGHLNLPEPEMNYFLNILTTNSDNVGPMMCGSAYEKYFAAPYDQQRQFLFGGE